MTMRPSRRRFLATSSLAGGAGLLRAPSSSAEEQAPETPTVRLPNQSQSGICTAPARIVGDLLQAEGFSDVRFVAYTVEDLTEAVGSGGLDFALNFASSLTAAIDRRVPITALAGINAGCFRLFGHEGTRGIADLRGRAVAVPRRGLRALHLRHRAGGRSREADDHPRNR